MTIGEMMPRVMDALKAIEASGFSFGRIELVVRDGEVKHVNVCYEIGDEREYRRETGEK